MRIFALFTCLFSFSFSAHGQTSRLELLQEQRKDAIERAISPINDRYVEELEKLLKTTMAAGDLDEAVKIREEIERFKKETPKPPAAATKPPEKFSEDWLIGTTWTWGTEDNGFTKCEFEKGRFLIYHQDDRGGWELLPGEWKWEVVSEDDRTLRVHWYAGEEIVQISQDLKSIDGSKKNWKRIED